MKLTRFHEQFASAVAAIQNRHDFPQHGFLEAVIRLMECKIFFALGTEPDPGDLEHVIYLFRKKTLFSSLLRGPAAEWFRSTIQDAMICHENRTLFITIFSDGRNKFRHRMEVEHYIRADGEEIRNFLHRVKMTVDKSWPDDMVGAAVADEDAECAAQARQRKQRYIDYTVKGHRPKYLQWKARESLVEHPKATWNDFWTHLINKDNLILSLSAFSMTKNRTMVRGPLWEKN